jgi:hypothetical protein
MRRASTSGHEAFLPFRSDFMDMPLNLINIANHVCGSWAMRLDIMRHAERAFGDSSLLELKSQGSALGKHLRLGAAGS